MLSLLLHDHWPHVLVEVGTYTKLTQNRCCNFQTIFTSPCLGSNSLSFPVFYPASNLTAFPFEFLAANYSHQPICCWYISIFNLGIWFFPDLDLGNLLFTFLFFSPTSSCAPLSLSFNALNLFLIYVSSFSLSFGWTWNLFRKQLTSKTISQNPLIILQYFDPVDALESIGLQIHIRNT